MVGYKIRLTHPLDTGVLVFIGARGRMVVHFVDVCWCVHAFCECVSCVCVCVCVCVCEVCVFVSVFNAGTCKCVSVCVCR